MKIKYLVIVVLLVVVIAVYSSRQANAPLEVDASYVVKGDIVEFVEERGRTRYGREFQVAVLVSGFVPPVKFDEGDMVEEGQVLAAVEDIPYRSAVEEVQAEIERLKALTTGVDAAKPRKEEIESARLALEIAKTRLESDKLLLPSLKTAAETAEWVYDKTKNLFESQKNTEAEFKARHSEMLSAKAVLKQHESYLEIDKLQVDAAQAALTLVTAYVDDNEYQREALKAQIKALESRLNMLRDNRKKTEILAPVSGKILERYSRGGAVLAAGTPLFLVGDPESIEIRVDLLTDDISKVRLGQNVILSGEVLADRTAVGKVVQILPTGFLKRSTLGVEQERVGVICSFDNSSLKLGPVYGIDVKIVTNEKKDVLHVQERAVFKKDGRHHVFAVKEGKAKLTAIETGLEGEDSYEIISGLNENEMVIVAPPAELEDGVEVKTMKK